MPILANIIIKNPATDIESTDVKPVATFDEIRRSATVQATFNDFKIDNQTRIENKINSKKTSKYLEDLTNKGD